jgi:hypothetical protein
VRKGDNLHLVPLSERLFYLESDPICTRELAISIVRTNQEFFLLEFLIRAALKQDLGNFKLFPQ